ncbi:MAG: hypothetical protein WAS27_02265 [Candidatus Saccharimonadales bacterium]
MQFNPHEREFLELTSDMDHIKAQAQSKLVAYTAHLIVERARRQAGVEGDGLIDWLAGRSISNMVGENLFVTQYAKKLFGRTEVFGDLVVKALGLHSSNLSLRMCTYQERGKPVERFVFVR